LLDNSKPLERVGRKASGLTPESAGYGSRVAGQRSHLSIGGAVLGIAKPFERSNHSMNIEVGNTSTYMLTNLESGKTYCFSATAFDTSGNESEYSEEIS
jgi:hypothetical protein